jgi:hypothetical protein
MFATKTVRPSGETATPIGVMPPVNWMPAGRRMPAGVAGVWLMRKTSTLSECGWVTNRKSPRTKSCAGPLPRMIFCAAV